MPLYAILQNPGHNRVYFNASRKLSVVELTLCARRLSAPISDIREEIIGGVPYLVFTRETPLTEEDIIRLFKLSFVYALFSVRQEGDEISLTPLLKDSFYYFNDDISTLMKYTGKTNELFTRMLLNLAVNTSAFDYPDGLRVLDPMCGKGTTLFESLLLGFHAYGVEIDEAMVHEAYVYVKKYLESIKYKHSAHTEKTGGLDANQKRFTAMRYQIELAKNKSDQRNDRTLQIEMIAGDTRHMNTYFKKNSFHLIVGDLPYGVRHGSDKKNQGSLTRNAMGMLTEALPEWLKVLKPGGVVVLAWNLFLIPRADIETLFTINGLTLPEDALFTQMAHRVDQAIERDVIIGIKPLSS